MSDSDLPDSGADPAKTIAKPDSPVATHVHPSPNHGERKGGDRPDMIILHYTGMPDAASALHTLCNPLKEVSSHYFIFEDGRVWQLVPESRRAWHAGRAIWHGETDLNSRSIGIEIVNPGHDLKKLPPVAHDYPDFPAVQIDATIALLKDIVARWAIPKARILAHSDIAPGRKIDPGERFPWERLAKSGLGLWPEGQIHFRKDAPSFRAGDEGMPIRALQSMFAAFGYGLEISGVYDPRTVDVVTAFQRHWRQSKVDGVADSETMAVLKALHSAATVKAAGS